MFCLKRVDFRMIEFQSWPYMHSVFVVTWLLDYIVLIGYVTGFHFPMNRMKWKSDTDHYKFIFKTLNNFLNFSIIFVQYLECNGLRLQQIYL